MRSMGSVSNLNELQFLRVIFVETRIYYTRTEHFLCYIDINSALLNTCLTYSVIKLCL